MPYGTSLEELELPETLRAIVIPSDSEDEGEDLVWDADLLKATTSDAPLLKATASNAAAADATPSNAEVSEASPSDADGDEYDPWEEVSVEWTVNSSYSRKAEYDGETPGIYVFDAELADDHYKLGEAMLPFVEVEVLEEDAVLHGFGKIVLTAETDGIRVTVTADPGVIPGDAEVMADMIAEEEHVEELKEAARLSGSQDIAALDITLRDGEGNEIQPDTGAGEFAVSFEIAGLSEEELSEVDIYHFTDDQEPEQVKKEETECVDGAVACSPEHFSKFLLVRAAKTAAEAFDGVLEPGGTYWFDLSGEKIPGKVNNRNSNGAAAVPDLTLAWVPFTYVGTINAYKLESAQATTVDYAQQNAADRSLFLGDYGVTHTVSWNELNSAGYIFGKEYESNGISYTMRAPSQGSKYPGNGKPDPVTPVNNEWDVILDKSQQVHEDNENGYIKNWYRLNSWGQDTDARSASKRMIRGSSSDRSSNTATASYRYDRNGYRPVLELPENLIPASMKVVQIDFNGGRIGEAETANIVVDSESDFTAPNGSSLIAPGRGQTFRCWTDENNVSYSAGDSVPADTESLTAQWNEAMEEGPLVSGETYWFDLSGAGLPGTVNNGKEPDGKESGAAAVPDTTLTWTPFTYAGVINAYKLDSSQDEAETAEAYDHGLFIADYVAVHSVGWQELSEQGFIFGTDYESGGIAYTLRAPSAGSKEGKKDNGYDVCGLPENNEWDVVLDKAKKDYSGSSDIYIRNWEKIYSYGQEITGTNACVFRGSDASNAWLKWGTAYIRTDAGFRPVLEVQDITALSSDSLRAVSFDLNGGSIGSSGEKEGKLAVDGSFPAPGGTGLKRPDGDSGDWFAWRGSDGVIYQAGDMIPAEVESLTALWEMPAPKLEAQPVGQSVTEGKTVSFYVAASGVELSYRWQVSKDGGNSWEDIPDAGENTFTIEKAVPGMDGWQYRCIVENKGGSITSDAAALTVSPASQEEIPDPTPEPEPAPEPAPAPSVPSGSSNDNDSNGGSAQTSSGQWSLTVDRSQRSLWSYRPDGSGEPYRNRWAYIVNPYASEGQPRESWFHFDENGYAESGWYKDTDGHWYYLHDLQDGMFGAMVTGWRFDSQDGCWYYLDPADGRMLTGWQRIHGKWYYFNPVPEGMTWLYDENAEKWYYDTDTGHRPYGSMYLNEKTPDGYLVKEDGSWDE